MSPQGSADADAKTADGRNLRYQVVGAPGGSPVFLLHGAPGSRIGPRPRSSVLYRLGVRLISYDRPGYGGSDRHAGRSIADCAADIECIADDLGLDSFAVVGRSGGGPHALASAALLPARVDRVAVLVSLAPHEAGEELDWYAGMNADNTRGFAIARADEQKLIERLRLQADRVQRSPLSLLDSLRGQISAPDRQVVGDLTIEKLLLEAYAEATRPGPYGWIDDTLAVRRDWGFDLADVRQPVLLWHGAEDNVVPASHARWLAARIPHADLRVQSGSAHFGAMGILPEILTWLVDAPVHA
ncbi:pimeloyl-ACP methyl ester carboxylesterase [Actinoplanes tereljensis]|uniref:Alpha/beta hydrolase n=1 Tax=Paractinoplanes tereljensis TaxID=571912 RepID=A0A919NQX2_9ACTN|nr:alpha/beta hydrolase [Actinoplanes tereljensis]GIF22187.1 alpha/beta hydrolase [Actinoplanes tereljensis]